MKKFNYLLHFACIAAVVAFTSCNKPGKITDITPTTQSAEAKTSFEQGLAMMDQGDFQKSRMAFSKAIEQDPKCAVAYMFRAITANSPKEYADNMAQAKSNLEGVSDYEKWYYQYTETFGTNDWNKRLDVAQKMATAFPDVPRTQVDLGTTYSSGNDEAHARECFAKAIQMNPNWVGGYTASVNSYIFVNPKDFKKGEENAMKATELAPNSAGSQIALGDCYRAQNNLEKARDAYGKAITLDPNTSEAYYKKGHANSFLGNLDEARQNYMEGAKHDDSKMGSVSAIGNSYLYGGDYKMALSYFTDQASKADASGDSPSNITATKYTCWSSAANIALHYGDAASLKDIVAKFEPVATQMGNDGGTEQSKIQQSATMSYWQSVLASLEGNFDAAKTKAEEMKTALAPINDPNKMDGYEFAMGFCAMKQKNYADAVDHFGKTQQNSTYNKYWLATANLDAGNKDKAASLYRDIADYNFNEVGYALVRNEVKKTLATL
jgi:tetratricopeptide (TPR) repeat protein